MTTTAVANIPVIWDDARDNHTQPERDLVPVPVRRTR
jgi:hypothetical protein